MRENMGLFRGKRIDNDKWVEGAYFKHDTLQVCFSSDDPKPKHLIIRDGFCDWGFEPPIHGVEVDPSTVGECTGLKDKNGKLIFEGDIVGFLWADAAMNFRIDFVSGEFLAVPVEQRKGVWAIRISGQGKDFEVIGNIHDNPELLES